ncbi:hypothetical protein Cgig2_010188 [Carnegiea gigantea]|uniref:Uncharacterized protein n=1 Tax=Carnegiea gigantea TaxID=171969 RepID=A0A9Q1K945_9CARY|nr:hypothetical protein Cgig2_010188 [Carnegiea gigantea]
MASRTNKFTSLNFNDIFDKQKNNSRNNITSALTSPSSKSQSLSSAKNSYSFSASTSHHGGMLVLSRPSPSSTHKPAPSSPLSPSPLNHLPSSPPPKPASDLTHAPLDCISLHPKGKTGSPSSSFPTLERAVRDPPSPASAPPLSPRSDKFVPPHLRPGFVARDQKPIPSELQRPDGEGDRPGSLRPGSAHGYYASSNRNREDGRPMSGRGGRKRVYGGGDSDVVGLSRSRSVGYNGHRPNCSGWSIMPHISLGA